MGFAAVNRGHRVWWGYRVGKKTTASDSYPTVGAAVFAFRGNIFWPVELLNL